MSDAFPRLKSFVERIERIQTEIDAGNADKKEIYAEAKGTGFDVKIMKLLIAERRKDSAVLAETNEMLDLYRAAMNGTVHAPVRMPAPARAEPVTLHDAGTGEIAETPISQPSEIIGQLDTSSCGALGDNRAEMSTPIRSPADNASLVVEGREGHDAVVVGLEPGPQETPLQPLPVSGIPDIPDFLRRAQPQGSA